jgi:hypothetical protein
MQTQKQAGMSVTEIVRSNPRQTSRFECAQKRAPHLVRREIVPRFVCEHEVACLPNLPNLQSDLVLPRFMRAKDIRKVRVDRYRSAAPV